MKRKQKLHEGNRDDAVLQELDALLAGGLEYTDMTDDIRRVCSANAYAHAHAHAQTHIYAYI
jgi:hypothetical protein